jgi:hypothetical protein
LRRTGLHAHNGYGAGRQRHEFQQQRKKFWSKRWVEESDWQASSLLRSASVCVPGLGPTEFLAPHGLAVDSHGDLYIGEVSWTNWPQTFRDKPRPDNLRSLHKFRKVV